MKHQGLHANGLTEAADNPREVAFAQEWHCENSRERYGIGTSRSTLGYLLGDGTLHGAIHPSDRDSTVSATVVQWLGSNVGMSFLRNALARFGMEIVKKK